MSSVSFRPDGKRVAGAIYSANGSYISVWDAETSQEYLTFEVPQPQHLALSSAVFSPDGRRIATTGGAEMRLWDVQTRQEILTLKHSENVKYLGSVLKIWDAASGRETQGPQTSFNVSDLAFSPDGRRLASAGGSTVKIWDTRTGQEILTFAGHSGGLWGVAFSPDGQRLASTGPTARTIIWDAQTGGEILTLKDPPSTAFPNGGGYGVAFSPDGKHLATTHFDGTVRIWNAQTGEERSILKGHILQAFKVAFSPDGRRLASASADRTVKLWDSRTGDELLTLKGHAESVQSVAFSADGRQLVTSSRDGTAKIWDATPVADKVVQEHKAVLASAVKAIRFPRGWGTGGGTQADFEMGLDDTVRHSGKASGFVKSKLPEPRGFGTFSQGFRADGYRTKRMRLSAFIKTEKVEGSAQMWTRIDSKTAVIGFDNMDDRPITGTTDWKKYEIILDVPADAVNIAFGFFLKGNGQVWADDFQFETVGQDVPTTKPTHESAPLGQSVVPASQATPLNLDFEK
jgi:WD40 repeat protein